MTRRFDSGNATPPAGMATLVVAVPKCFEAESWALYLDECWRETRNDAPARRRLERGEIPDFCLDCQPEFRARRMAEGRCEPPAGATPPNMESADASA